jgi:IclR family acetate operon transcriptional repressor
MALLTSLRLRDSGSGDTGVPGRAGPVREPAVTGQTMTRRCDLLAEPDRARARGYARNSGESEEGVSSTGVAIVHPLHGVLGAITIAVPLSRMTQQKEERHAALLAEASRGLTAQLA